MTLLRTPLVIAAPEAEETKSMVQEEGARADWKYWIAGVAILAVAYVLLQNGKWVSGPDTAFYISVARNLALGRGFVFNGAVVGRIPPLWPAVLAAGLKGSTSFALSNLLPMVCLLGGMAGW